MKHLVLCILLIAGGFFVFSRFRVPAENVENKLYKNQVDLGPQTNSEGSVSVGVTPIDISESSKPWKFKITLDTHSEELDQDLTKITALTDSKGNVYQPIFWEGSPPGGHHREGTLSFEPISPRPNKIVMEVKEIGGVAKREFNWTF